VKGWIIYKDSPYDIHPEKYEIDRLMEEAERLNIEMHLFMPEQFDLIVTQDDDKSILLNEEYTSLPDFVLPRMGARTTYYSLAVLRQLERLGVHIFNSPESIDIVKDKLYTHQILAKSGIPVPKTMLIKYPIDVRLVEKHIGFPVVVKTISGSQGSGVFLCETKSHFEDLIQLIKETRSHTNIILQEFVKSSRGRDLRVITIGGRAIACMERIATNGGFKANFSTGGEVRNYPMNAEIEWLATESSRILNLDIAGIDLLFDGEHYKICEANSSPGFKGIEQCSGINIPEEIYHYIQVRLGLF